jgi:hypothetical protein
VNHGQSPCQERHNRQQRPPQQLAAFSAPDFRFGRACLRAWLGDPLQIDQDIVRGLPTRIWLLGQTGSHDMI